MSCMRKERGNDMRKSKSHKELLHESIYVSVTKWFGIIKADEKAKKWLF